MLFYHGSSTGGLTELRPHMSRHGKCWLYLTNLETVAAFYTVHCLERPAYLFPYGFNKKNELFFTEYYPDAFADMYKGKSGFIYRCRDINPEPLEAISSYASEKPVPVDSVTEIDDIYEWLLEKERQGLLQIRRYDPLYQRKLDWVAGYIEDLKLLENPESHNARFFRERFPEIWQNHLKQ